MPGNSPTSQVFVVGMNGSGTTMLRDHLANHSRIYGFPSETRSLPYFIGQQHEFGNLQQERNYLHLWDAMKKSVSKHSGILPADLQAPGPSARSAAGTFDHIMRSLAAAEGKDIWCEKTPMYVHHLTMLGESFPGARFIHVIRDGRDCAASFHRRWGFNPVRTIFRWKQAVRRGREQGRLLGGRYCEVRYEELTVTPETALRSLLEFLGLPFEEGVLSSARPAADPATSLSPGIVRNVRKAGDYFDHRTLRRIESVAGSLLAELGYASTAAAGDSDPPAWRLKWWRTTDDIRRFAMVSLTGGRILQPSKWRYISARIRNAIKQRATTKS